MPAYLRHQQACSVRMFDLRTLLVRRLAVIFCLLSCGFTVAMAREPVHQLIDRLLPVPAGVPDRICSDAEFLRRVSLDLIGIPPTADEARSFLADSSADKRSRLIDQLLESPLLARHVATSLDLMLMERRANSHVAQDDWMNWLMQCIREDRPWNEVAREILAADGDDPAHRAPARFYLDRGAEPNLIARDVGRIFFGMDLQCAQCHDSPLVADFLQADYHGLLAFVVTGAAVTKKHGDKDVTVYAERAGSDLAFESVFNKGILHRIGPRLPGDGIVGEPFAYPGDEYVVAPADNVRSVPRFSRRQWLAEHATSGTNPAFHRNAANRFWALMFGRGLIHPLDMVHPDNGGPGFVVLDELAARFAADGFRIRQFLREIALSRTYQRPFDPLPLFQAESAASGSVAPESVPSLPSLDSLTQAAESATSRYNAAGQTYDTTEQKYVPLYTSFEQQRTAFADARTKHDAARAAVDAATAALTGRQQLLETLQGASQALTKALSGFDDSVELQTASQTLNQRVAAVTAEIPGLQAALDEKQGALQPLVEPLAAARVALDSAWTSLSPVRETLVAAATELADARRMFQVATMRLESVRQISDTVTQPAQLQSLQDSVTAVQSSLGQVEQRQGQQAQTLQQLITETDSRTRQLQTVQASVAESQERVVYLEAERATSESVLDRLQEAETALVRFVSAAPESSQSAQQTQAVLKPAIAEWQAKTEAGSIALDAARTELAAVVSEQAAAALRLSELQEAIAREKSVAAELQSEQDRLTAELAESQSRLESAVEDCRRKFENAFLVAPLKPLTPEQLCWSVFRVTTVYERYAANEIAELDKAQPPGDAPDAAAVTARAIEVERRTFEKLRGNVATFVQLYGGAAGQPQGDFYASADQALFAANGGSIVSWLAPAGDNPVERMINATDPQLAAEELYLGILTRMPSSEEVDEIGQVLASASDRAQACQAIAWGLLNSAEFRFNH